MEDVSKRRMIVSVLYRGGTRNIDAIQEQLRLQGIETSDRNVYRDIRAAQQEGNNWVAEVGDYAFALLYKQSYEKMEEMEKKLETLANQITVTKAWEANIKASIYSIIVDIQQKKMDAMLQGPLVWHYSMISKKYPMNPQKKVESVLTRAMNRLPEEIGNGKLETPT